MANGSQNLVAILFTWGKVKCHQLPLDNLGDGFPPMAGLDAPKACGTIRYLIAVDVGMK
jgi:hypothetical protein